MGDELWAKIALIASAVAEGRYRYTVHGTRQRIARGIQPHEIEQAIAIGEIIQDYPQHHYGAACLILGRSAAGRPLHVLCSTQSPVAIITVYEPASHEWEADLRTRRR